MKTKGKPAALIAKSLLAWAVLVALQADSSFGVVGMALVGLLFCASLLGFGMAAFAGSRSTRDLGLILFIVLSSSWAATFISHRQQAASVAAAQPIIAAAERYRLATGAYPPSMDHLVPEYLPAEPHPQTGFRARRFTLSSGPDQFHLFFPISGWMMYGYNSKSKQWKCLD